MKNTEAVRAAFSQMQRQAENLGAGYKMIYLMADIHEHPPTREYYGGIERAYHELGLTEEIAGVLEPALARARHRAKMRRGTRSGK